MKLSALLLLAASASACVAQNTPTIEKAAGTQDQGSSVGVVDDQAISRAANALAETAQQKELQKTMRLLSHGNCPVLLTSAWMTPHLMLLTTTGESNGNGIDLEFNNVSGKEIRSMEFSARILVKKSIYDLGYIPAIQLYLTANGVRNLDKTFAQLRHLQLPENIQGGLVESVTLEQVNFADGSIWTPTGSDYCGVGPNQMLPVAR